jgi:phage gp16-like protein
MHKPILIGNREKALIHVAKAQLGLSDEAYREMLASVGVASSRDLTPLQFDELLRRLEAGGFKATGRRGKKSATRKKAAPDREPLLKKIEAILLDTGLTWEYANGIARNMFGVTMVRWCNAQQLWRVAAALSIYQKRKAKRAGKAAATEGAGEKEGGKDGKPS